MLDNYIETEIFRKTFQRLTFTPSIQLYTLCDLAFSKEFFDNYDYEIGAGVVGDDYISNQRRFGRILERLCIEKKSKLTAINLFAETKIYDEFMLESQIRLYNKSAEMIG